MERTRYRGRDRCPTARGVITRAAGTAASVEVADLAAALRRAQVYRPESLVVVDVDHDTMTITTSSPQAGENTETLPVAGYTGPPARFGINPDYLATALSALGGTTAELAVPPTARTPMALRPVEQPGTGQVQVVMPVRLPEHQDAAA